MDSTPQTRLSQELKAAMLAKDADRLSTLRLLKSAVGYAEIERKSESLPDAEVVALVQKEIKKRRDAMEQYQSGGRPGLAERERREVEGLETVLAPPLSSEGVERLVG